MTWKILSLRRSVWMVVDFKFGSVYICITALDWGVLSYDVNLRRLFNGSDLKYKACSYKKSQKYVCSNLPSTQYLNLLFCVEIEH